MATAAEAPKLFAGDLLEISCPPETQVLDLGVGDIIKIQDKVAYVVVRKEVNKVFLGPTRSFVDQGVEISCSDGSKVKAQMQIQGLDANKQMPQEAPVGVFGLSFPMTVVWLALLIVSVLSAGTWAYLKWKRERNEKRTLKNKKAVDRDPGEEFQLWLGKLGEELCLKSESISTDDLKKFYSQGQHLLRKYLEYCLYFSSHASTTLEFVGDFKMALGRKGAKGELLELPGLLESLLQQSDNVRFASDMTPLSHRKAFSDGLLKFRKLLDPFYRARKNPPEDLLSKGAKKK